MHFYEHLLVKYEKDNDIIIEIVAEH